MIDADMEMDRGWKEWGQRVEACAFALYLLKSCGFCLAVRKGLHVF